MLRRIFCLTLLGWTLAFSGFAQTDLSYYFGEGTTFNPDIPTPESVLGYQVGEWHVSHDQMLLYMRAVAEASDRIVLETIGYTHERRALIHLMITSPENHAKLDEIQALHVQLTDPEQSGKLKVEEMPVVVNLGYNIHGNEPSGGNAALLVAYYMAAAQGDFVEQVLDNAVLMLDPCLNPDGLHRFATWANMHKGINVINPDPASREHNEVWPRGRTNHYWFDLNRDWLPVQHPESRARIRRFHEWKPNFLTDHHEMGTNSTFFFQPGVPSRNHPLSPEKVFSITDKMANYHAEALDKIGSLYYTKEGFDDFYYGKGSTYPDVNGGVGILFEQASSRGHAQNTVNGLLTFPFTIKNQLTTSLSTIRGTVALREELLNHQRDFFKTAVKEANQDEMRAFVFQGQDLARNWELASLIRRHDIQIYQLGADVSTDGQTFKKDEAYIVPLQQPQYRLIKGMFEVRTSFQDSLFYDVSAWTLPMAFGLEYAALDRKDFRNNLLGDPFTAEEKPVGKLHGEATNYAYVFPWHDYYAARTLAELLSKGIRVKVATKPFSDDLGRNFSYGTIMVPVTGQDLSPDEMYSLMKNMAERDGLQVYSLATGHTEGVSLGSNSFRPLRDPKALLVVGGRVSSYEAGEVWHLLDQRLHMDLSIIDVNQMGGLDLSAYRTMIMVGGAYNSLPTEKIKAWLTAGGNLIAYKSAIRWLAGQKIGGISLKSNQDPADEGPLAYADRSNIRGAQVIGGAIFKVDQDLTHPMNYGYTSQGLKIFRNSSLMMEPSKNPFSSPVRYQQDPLASGYTSEENAERLGGTAAVVVSRQGRGRVIAMTDNPNFRAFWFGTNRLFFNALFFGQIME
ncbi:MAG: M14 metallopeptidase family protein [Bacteroidota bacterium]